MNKEIASRIIEIRKFNNLTQTEFAKRLNTTRPKIASYELYKVNFDYSFLDYICKVFGINSEWLLTGNGEMLKENKSTFMDSLKVRFSLDDIDVEIVSMYLETPPEYRKMFRAYVKGLVETGYSQYIKENPNKSNKTTSDIDIEKEVENYRKELEAEKRVMEKSSALPTAKDA